MHNKIYHLNHFKFIIQRHEIHSQSHATTTTLHFQNFFIIETETSQPLNTNTLPILPSHIPPPVNLYSTYFLYEFDYSRFYV